ncbi:MAG TPA: hypothetical protein PLD83_08570, partial [Oscillospiraceae bacterium]|nr:hypothetical protein [Oscillospiraceae bacterium]
KGVSFFSLQRGGDNAHLIDVPRESVLSRGAPSIEHPRPAKPVCGNSAAPKFTAQKRRRAERAASSVTPCGGALLIFSHFSAAVIMLI